MTNIEYKNAFIKKHGSKGDWRVDTSPMYEDGKYVKVYIFDDGAQLIEINRPVDEVVDVEVEVKGIKITTKLTVRLMESECWNTDDSESVFFYEKW